MIRVKEIFNACNVGSKGSDTKGPEVAILS